MQAPQAGASACFVLPVEDTLEGISRSLAHMMLIHRSGGGTGFSFGRLRPRGDAVSGTMGVASGPVSFMRVFDTATGAVKQGGRRRGANMGVLPVSHPDIEEFITSKQDGGLSNFNISIGIDTRFLHCLRTGRDYDLINPRDDSVWKSADPDRSGTSPLHQPGQPVSRGCSSSMRSTGETQHPILVPSRRRTPAVNSLSIPTKPQPGSINLARCIRKHDLDEDLLITVVRCGIDFLDAVIDVNRFLLPEIRTGPLLPERLASGSWGLLKRSYALICPTLQMKRSDSPET